MKKGINEIFAAVFLILVAATMSLQVLLFGEKSTGLFEETAETEVQERLEKLGASFSIYDL